MDVLTCAVRENPWQCVYSRSGKMLESLDAVVQRKEEELKGMYLYIVLYLCSAFILLKLAFVVAKGLRINLMHC